MIISLKFPLMDFAFTITYMPAAIANPKIADRDAPTTMIKISAAIIATIPSLIRNLRLFHSSLKKATALKMHSIKNSD